MAAFQSLWTEMSNLARQLLLDTSPGRAKWVGSCRITDELDADSSTVVIHNGQIQEPHSVSFVTRFSPGLKLTQSI